MKTTTAPDLESMELSTRLMRLEFPSIQSIEVSRDGSTGIHTITAAVSDWQEIQARLGVRALDLGTWLADVASRAERLLSGAFTQPLTSADVAALRDCSTKDAERWIATHAKRLAAWKTGEVGGQWRVCLAKLKRARLQLGDN